MAVIKAVSSKAGIGQAIDYVSKDEKTEEKLLSGYNCQPETAQEEMQLTKEAWQKTDGRTYKHFVQSFHKDEPITPELAHKIANEFVEKCPQFQGFEVLIATHQDREHVHTHFIVNSVSFEDGHKFRYSKHELQQMKNLSDEIIKSHGLKVVEKGKTYEGADREQTSTYTKEAYQQQKKAESGEVKSYIQDIAKAVLEEKEKATSKEEFIANLQSRGIGVDWQESHKYITFIDLERQEQGEKQCKIRDNKITKYYNIDVSKETLINEFERNGARAEQLESAVTELRDFDQRTERKTSQAGARAESGEIKKSESAGTNAELQNAVGRGRRTEARASDPRETDKRIGEFRRTMESAGRTMEQASRIIDQSAAAIDRSIRTISEITQPEQGEGEQNNAAIEYEIKLLRELNTEISRTSKEFEYCRKEQSDINQQSNNIRDGLKELKERIRDLGEAHRGIKERITDCFRKQSDIGERIEQAINQTIDRVFRRGGR